MTEVLNWIGGATFRDLFIALAVAGILVGAAREWWVWGYVYRREREEKEYWREKTLSLMGLAEKSADLAAKEIVETQITKATDEK